MHSDAHKLIPRTSSNEPQAKEAADKAEAERLAAERKAQRREAKKKALADKLEAERLAKEADEAARVEEGRVAVLKRKEDKKQQRLANKLAATCMYQGVPLNMCRVHSRVVLLLFFFFVIFVIFDFRLFFFEPTTAVVVTNIHLLYHLPLVDVCVFDRVLSFR
jgi:hypothetical protein